MTMTKAEQRVREYEAVRVIEQFRSNLLASQEALRELLVAKVAVDRELAELRQEVVEMGCQYQHWEDDVAMSCGNCLPCREMARKGAFMRAYHRQGEEARLSRWPQTESRRMRCH